MRIHFDDSLRIGSNILTVIVSLAALTVLALGYFHPPTAIIDGALKRGDTLGNVSGLTLTAPKTVILALSTTCPFCKASAPFYRKLRTRLIDSHSTTALIALFPEDTSKANDFLRSLDLDLRSMPRVTLQKLNIARTPTIVLVDRKGKILNYWIGSASPTREQEIFHTLLGS